MEFISPDGMQRGHHSLSNRLCEDVCKAPAPPPIIWAFRKKIEFENNLGNFPMQIRVICIRLISIRTIFSLHRKVFQSPRE